MIRLGFQTAGQALALLSVAVSISGCPLVNDSGRVPGSSGANQAQQEQPPSDLFGSPPTQPPPSPPPGDSPGDPVAPVSAQVSMTIEAVFNFKKDSIDYVASALKLTTVDPLRPKTFLFLQTFSTDQLQLQPQAFRPETLVCFVTPIQTMETLVPLIPQMGHQLGASKPEDILADLMAYNGLLGSPEDFALFVDTNREALGTFRYCNAQDFLENHEPEVPPAPVPPAPVPPPPAPEPPPPPVPPVVPPPVPPTPPTPPVPDPCPCADPAKKYLEISNSTAMQCGRPQSSVVSCLSECRAPDRSYTKQCGNAVCHYCERAPAFRTVGATQRCSRNETPFCIWTRTAGITTATQGCSFSSNIPPVAVGGSATTRTTAGYCPLMGRPSTGPGNATCTPACTSRQSCQNVGNAQTPIYACVQGMTNPTACLTRTQCLQQNWPNRACPTGESCQLDRTRPGQYCYVCRR